MGIQTYLFRNKIIINFKVNNKITKILTKPGISILELAKQNNIELEGACDSSLACSTCHVIVENEKFFNKLPETTEEEEDMLDLAFGLTDKSRLGCQIIVKKQINGITLIIPKETRNFSIKD